MPLFVLLCGKALVEKSGGQQSQGTAMFLPSLQGEIVQEALVQLRVPLPGYFTAKLQAVE